MTAECICQMLHEMRERDFVAGKGLDGRDAPCLTLFQQLHPGHGLKSAVAMSRLL